MFICVRVGVCVRHACVRRRVPGACGKSARNIAPDATYVCLCVFLRVCVCVRLS
jgi:hypothetical protein